MKTIALINDPVRWAALLGTKSEGYWIKRGERMACALLADMARNVPAYKKHLADFHIRLPKKPGMRDFLSAPIIGKDSYLRKYPLTDLCWMGSLTGMPRIVSATSGSTGDPFYFPRSQEQDLQYAAVAEMYLRSNFSIHTKSTLFIVGWGMGVWIGGVFSYAAIRIVAERGKYPLSIITPGTSSDEILKAVQKFAPLYDQIIIGGYPPMIKDLIDEGERRGMEWKKSHVKFIFSAEGFSEAFRTYVIKHAGLLHEYTDTLNHYGSVDLGTMAHETPLAILVRRLAVKNPVLNEALFGQKHNQPTLAQYIPELFYFEADSGNLLCTARSGIPLVRYDLMDTGGILTFKEMQKVFAAYGVNLDAEIKKAGIAATVWNIPFVYLFERRDFTVKIFGANIYPQEIRRALEAVRFRKVLTGKHTAEAYYDQQMNQSWNVHVELQKNSKSSVLLMREIQAQIISELTEHNSEFANNLKSMGERRMTPNVFCWPYGSPPHFSSSGKHKWVRKT